MNREYETLSPQLQRSVESAVEALSAEKTVEEVREMLSVTKEGKVAGTVDNYKIIFTYDPLLRNAFRLNLLTEKIDITKSLGWFRASDALSEVDIQYLILYLEQNYGIANQKKIEGMIKLVANENRFHPICDYLNALQWDGQERIRYALKYFLGAEVSDFNYEALRDRKIAKWQIKTENS